MGRTPDTAARWAGGCGRQDWIWSRLACVSALFCEGEDYISLPGDDVQQRTLIRCRTEYGSEVSGAPQRCGRRRRWLRQRAKLPILSLVAKCALEGGFTAKRRLLLPRHAVYGPITNCSRGLDKAPFKVNTHLSLYADDWSLFDT